MISQFEQLIIDITDELQCSPEEKHDIQMELRDHLYTSYEHYEAQGMLSEEAIQHVVAEFGQKNIVSEQLQLAVNPLFGLTKKIVWIVFIAYSVIVFWKVLLSRLVIRILDYVRASEPYYFSFVRNDPRTLEHKQFFDFSLWEQNLNLQPLKSIFFYVTTDRVNFNIVIDNLLGNIIAATRFTTTFSFQEMQNVLHRLSDSLLYKLPYRASSIFTSYWYRGY